MTIGIGDAVWLTTLYQVCFVSALGGLFRLATRANELHKLSTPN